jgi:hypothetical protein
MVRPGRRAAAVLAVLTATAVWFYAAGRPLAPAAPGRSRAPAEQVEELPRIDLARLDAREKQPELGERDIFDFGVERRGRPEPAAAPPAAPTPPPPPVEALAPPPPPVPPLRVRYIGALEDKKGLKVAFFMTEDKKEILFGQAGEVVANRLKIVKIGYESVDVQDVGEGRVRRIPLKGN